MSVVDLARIQFAANISFHILFPTISLSLAWVLLYFRIRYLRSGALEWLQAYQFWVKVFALTFALGVVSGITMSFQFGTNWPGYMETVGNIAGPLLAYEILTAFFLEATFLGIMLFGMHRVSNTVHTIATLLVAVGTSLSAFWILALNSWMHTPAGYEIRNGVAFATNWSQIIFNPSMPYRTSHMLLASCLTTAFLIAGISAYRQLRGDHGKDVLLTFRCGVVLAAVIIPLQIIAGDLHGLNTLRHQPAKIAAMEGVWETDREVPLLLFALPDEKNRTNHYEIGIPALASLILTHKTDGEIRGLNDFNDIHPPVKPLFFGFRLMVGIGLLMLLVSWYAALTVWKSRDDSTRPAGKFLLHTLVAMTFSGWVATLAGWYVTEIGRQPWLVEGVLRTRDAAAPVASGDLRMTLTLYLVLYAFLLASYISTLFYMARRAHTTSPVASTGPRYA